MIARGAYALRFLAFPLFAGLLAWIGSSESYARAAGCHTSSGLAAAGLILANPEEEDSLGNTAAAAPDIKIEKWANDRKMIEVLPGEEVAFTLKVTNNGAINASEVPVEDFLPSGMAYVEGSSLSSGAILLQSSPRLRWKIPSLLAGGTVQITFKTKVESPPCQNCCGTELVNQAIAGVPGVSFPAGTDYPGGCESGYGYAECGYAVDSARVRIMCQAPPDLTLSEKFEILDKPLRGGSLIQYELTLKNEGETDAVNVSVIDAISPVTTNIHDVSAKGGNGNIGSWSWTSDTLNVIFRQVKAGETCRIAFKVQLKRDVQCNDVVVNRAKAVFGNIEVASNKTSFTVDCPPDLCSSKKTVKDLNGGKLRPGDELEYRITLVNSSSNHATGVRVTDVLSPGLESRIAIAQIPIGSENHSDGALLDIRNIAVPSGASAEIVFRVRVRKDAEPGSRINNVALIDLPFGTGQTCPVRSPDLVVSGKAQEFEIIGRIDLGGDSVMAAVNPKTHEAVVTSALSNRIVIIDLEARKVAGYVRVESPYGVAVNPETNEAVVTNLRSDTVTIVDLAGQTVTAVIPVGRTPKGVAVNPRIGQAVIANSGSRSVSVVDLALKKVVATIPVGYGPNGVAINPLSNKAAVSNYLAGEVGLIDLTGFVQEASIPGEEFPLGVAFNSSTNLLYTADQANGSLSNIDPETRQLLGHIDLGSSRCMPDQVAIDDEANLAVVSLFNEHAVVFVNLADGGILERVDMRQAGGRGPRGVAMDRELGIVLVVHQQSNIAVLVGM